MPRDPRLSRSNSGHPQGHAVHLGRAHPQRAHRGGFREGRRSSLARCGGVAERRPSDLPADARGRRPEVARSVRHLQPRQGGIPPRRRSSNCEGQVRGLRRRGGLHERRFAFSPAVCRCGSAAGSAGFGRRFQRVRHCSNGGKGESYGPQVARVPREDRAEEGSDRGGSRGLSRRADGRPEGRRGRRHGRDQGRQGTGAGRALRACPGPCEAGDAAGARRRSRPSRGIGSTAKTSSRSPKSTASRTSPGRPDFTSATCRWRTPAKPLPQPKRCRPCPWRR